MDKERPIARLGRPTIVPGEKPTREKIFDAAIDLFSRQGYDGVSVRQIAGAVGLTESAVYRHYPSKEAILDAIFAYVERSVYTPLPIEREVLERPGVSIFRGLLADLPRVIMADPSVVKIMRIMFAEMHRNAKFRDYYQKELVERADDYMESFFHTCIERGALRPCDGRALAQVFNAFRSEWAFQTFIVEHEEPLDADAIAKGLEAPIRFFEGLLIPSRGDDAERR